MSCRNISLRTLILLSVLMLCTKNWAVTCDHPNGSVLVPGLINVEKRELNSGGLLVSLKAPKKFEGQVATVFTLAVVKAGQTIFGGYIWALESEDTFIANFETSESYLPFAKIEVGYHPEKDTEQSCSFYSEYKFGNS